MKDDSRCPKRILCDFQVSRDLPDAQVEICLNCSKKVIYHKDGNGRVDNRKYLRDHIRQTVQPFGPTRRLFMEIYGEGPLRVLFERSRGLKSKDQINREWEVLRKDIQRKLRQTHV